MNKRLREIIRYKTNGRQKRFAELTGMSPQYIAKLLHGDNFGLQPVLTILKALPEINARWFLTGEGEMLLDKVSELKRDTLSHIHAVIDLERFIPVMSPEEMEIFNQIISSHKTAQFTPGDRSRWIELMAERKI